MIQRLDWRSGLPAGDLLDHLPRNEVDVDHARDVAESLVVDVRANGESALRNQAEKFDGGAPASIRVPQAEIARAEQELPDDLRGALVEMIARLRKASEPQRGSATSTEVTPHGIVERRFQPFESAGVYIPGGRAVYPSSVVMNVVPAQVAGVKRIVAVSPPQREHAGGVHPHILGALSLLGVDEVYAMGGAGAIGALAYGVPGLLEPVQIITGPGNAYVAAAKRVVTSRVGIDSEAGPTEILVLADASANAALVAADLVSQAEHDPLASAVLVTDSVALADNVAAITEEIGDHLATRETIETSLSSPQSAIVVVASLADAVRVSNAYAPEHLSIQTSDDDAVLSDITNAGAIFMGAFSPVSLGDYLAGSNHVLPTGGQAAFASGLGVHTFQRPQQIIRYDEDALAAAKDAIVTLANAEGLPAHGAAIEARTIRKSCF